MDLPAELLEPDESFDAFAAIEPLFSVITDPRYRSSSVTSEQQAAFFASGEALVSALCRTIELRVAPHFGPSAILEYGCGAGRLVGPLARLAAQRDGHVTAVDRSPAMRRHTRAEVERLQLANVEVVAPRDLFEREERRFDFVVCYLVLQRLPQEIGLRLIDALERVLLPGGIMCIQCPISTRSSRSRRFVRMARQRLGILNSLANMLQGQDAGQPPIPTHPYSASSVLGRLRQSAAAAHVVFEDHGDVESIVAIAEAPMVATADPSLTPQGHPPADLAIDVRDVIASVPPGELNARAEEYFSTLDDWTHHLAKPWASVDEAPWLLLNSAILLQALALRPGCVVLEFGAGTGWLSRFFSQLGCQSILLDVSPTALRIARDLYDRLPIVGHAPEPRFLLFDGEKIDLPDASVDRIACFHAFHHAPHPMRVLEEFGRVLRPGGRAAFAEPGPRHSLTPQSQFEMKSYGVIENDVDLHAIWRRAQAVGFRDMRVALFHGRPYDVSLDEYEEFIRGGAATNGWVAATRVFLRNVANFVLVKDGNEPLDSRSSEGLRCALQALDTPAAVKPGDPVVVTLRATNTGDSVWLPTRVDPGGVGLGVRVFARDRRLVESSMLPEILSAVDVRPGESRDVRVAIVLKHGGPLTLEVDCVARGVTWFAQCGSTPIQLNVHIGHEGRAVTFVVDW